MPSGEEVARLFLGSQAPVVRTRTRGPGEQGRFVDRSPRPSSPSLQEAPLTLKPLVVLVNKRTASASEIVAGALRDGCRATVVADRAPAPPLPNLLSLTSGGRKRGGGEGATFGKGLIQSVYELSDGSGMVVTVGEYILPGGAKIDGVGVVADFTGPHMPSLQDQEDAIQACRVNNKPGDTRE